MKAENVIAHYFELTELEKAKFDKQYKDLRAFRSTMNALVDKVNSMSSEQANKYLDGLLKKHSPFHKARKEVAS